MAQAATLFTFAIDLSDMNRGVFETLSLRVPRHPSETMAFMVARVLAYCLEYRPGIELTGGVSDGEQPAIVVRDPTGQITGWIEVGLPDAARLHRGSKLAQSVAVYTHRDARQLLAQLHGEKIHRADTIRVRAFDRAAIETIAEQIERRTDMAVSVSDEDLFVSIGARTVTVSVSEHRL